MPRRTLSPRISTTVMTTSQLMTIDSFFFLDSTSMGVYLLSKQVGFGVLTRHSVGLDSPPEGSIPQRLRGPSRSSMFCARRI